MLPAFEQRVFAEEVLRDLDALHQIPMWKTEHPHGYTEEYKKFVVEASMWLAYAGVVGGGVIWRALEVKVGTYRQWWKYRTHKGYIPQYAHDALKNWTPGDDPATVVPADTAAPERLEETR